MIFLFHQILLAIITIVFSIATPIILALLNKAINLGLNRLKLDITQNQKDNIRSAVETGSGLIQTAVMNGILKESEINPDHPIVQGITRRAFSNVQESASHLDVTPERSAVMIVGKYGRLNAKSPPIVMT